MKITLYVKTHNVTGLKYFGKVSDRKDPFAYHGSGVYWKKHLKKHGYDLTTEIVGVFDSVDECSKAAIQFSIDNNIVESDQWANLRIENGMDGAPAGHVGSYPSYNTRKLISEQSSKRWSDIEYRKRVVASHKRRWTAELRNRQSVRLKSEFWTDERKKLHAEKMRGRRYPGKGRGTPKPDGFGKNVSERLKGKRKTPEHIRNFSLSRQKDKRALIDHLGNRYDLHADFTNKYGIDFHHFYNLDSRIRIKSSYAKLGIDYNANKWKTKRELGFRFE